MQNEQITADFLTQDAPTGVVAVLVEGQTNEPPIRLVISHDVAEVLKYIAANRKADGTVTIVAPEGRITKWRRENNDLIPEMDSKVYTLEVKDFYVCTAVNAAGEYSRVGYIDTPGQRSARALELHTFGEERKLVDASNWVSLDRNVSVSFF